MKLEEKVAVITGAGRGLGRAIALAFAEEGARVVIVSRSREEIDRVAGEINAMGSKVLALRGDVSRSGEVSRLMQEVMNRFSRLDILVNNASVMGPPRFLQDADVESWEKAIAINLHGVFFCSREAALIMSRQRGGKIINITSGLGQMPYPRFCAYAVSKAGVSQMTRSLAEELKECRIQVNAIDPGVMDTRLQKDLRNLGASVLGKDIHEHFLQYEREGRLKDPAVVASLAVFLASPEADHLTGHIGTLDSYRHLGWPHP
jgi:3-oxoacyl-[acyl-carrier protein] reductase